MERIDRPHSLEELVSAHVKPGMTLYLAPDTSALVRELVRQFHGKKPEFTIIVGGVRHYAGDLVHCGIAKKLIFSAAAEDYPKRRPNRALQRAWRNHTMEIENWSALSFVQRLQAAALGVRFMPTNSLVGSTMAEENKDSFAIIDDPFVKGKKQAVVRTLDYDLALIHGSAVDMEGNTIVFPSVQAGRDGMWGALGARDGVLVSAEKLVTDEFMWKYSFLGAIPGCVVKDMAIVPLGAHPVGLINFGLADFEAYGVDEQFAAARSSIAQDPKKLDEWIKEWILGCPTQEAYLKKLGPEKIAMLRNISAGATKEQS